MNMKILRLLLLILIAAPTADAAYKVNPFTNKLDYYEASGSGTPGGDDSEVQFNNSSAFGGDDGLTFDDSLDTLTIGAAGTDGILKIYSEQGATDYYTLFQPGTQTQDITYTLPVNDGNSGQLLSSNGSGLLSWVNAGGFVVGGAITSGTDTRVIFDDGATIGEDSGFTYNKTTDLLTASGGFQSGAIDNPSIIFDSATSGDTDFWMGVRNDTDGVSNDYFKIGSGTTPGSNVIFTLDLNGKFGLATTPSAWMHIVPPTTASVATTPGTASSNSITLTGNAGGATTIATTGVGGVGGGVNMTLGTGGIAGSAATSSTGGKGGSFTINVGAGAAAAVAGTGTNTGGAGGDFNITGGTGGAATGNTSSTNTGGQGSTFAFIAGTGGAANTGSGNLVGGTGGGFTIRAGTGGIGTTSGGGGGNITVQGGLAAAMAGASAGGTITIKGGNASSTGSGGPGGPVAITGTDAGGDNTVNRAGGTITLTAGAAKGSNTGASISIIAGAGGVGTAATGATGGPITLTPGAGGAGSSTGGSGGALTLNGGLGGDTTSDGAGGDIIFKTATTITSAQRAIIDENGRLHIGTQTVPTAGPLTVEPPSAQTIAGGDIVVADACGSVKAITSGGGVTTSTSNTFTAPAAANAGCIMHVCNTGANNITLDNNSNFKSAGGADVVMTADDCVLVGNISTVWYQLSALEAN